MGSESNGNGAAGLRVLLSAMAAFITIGVAANIYMLGRIDSIADKMEVNAGSIGKLEAKIDYMLNETTKRRSDK